MHHIPSTLAGPAHPAGSITIAIAISVGALLWLTTAVCAGYLALQGLKLMGAMVLVTVAAMFGVSLPWDPGRSVNRLLLGIGSAGVSAVLCGFAYFGPTSLRALPGSTQFAVLGLLAALAPVTAVLVAAARRDR
ncbi:hypothetical protein [Streptomyces sp. NPDC101150]|uniref:hypothetical protein n=1 Tax=Streptomyces sp. NPDC101150 TaxID=3366114 RepID=UPI003815953A